MAKLTLGTGAFLWCHAGAGPPVSAPAGVVSTCAWQLGSDRTYALEGFVPNAGGVTSWLRQLGLLDAQALAADPALAPWPGPAGHGACPPCSAWAHLRGRRSPVRRSAA